MSALAVVETEFKSTMYRGKSYRTVCVDDSVH